MASLSLHQKENVKQGDYMWFR